MKAWLTRTKIQTVDMLRHSPTVREATGWLLYWRGLCSGNPANRARHLARAIGFASSETLIGKCIQAIRHKPGIEGATAAWREVVSTVPRYRESIERRPQIDRSIVLKAPQANDEKGVLLMTFEYNWARLLLGLQDEAFRWLDEHYDLILSTSWSPTDYGVLALALSRVKGPVYVQICNRNEIATVERFDPRLKCLPTMPCDWINPRLFEPKPLAERTTDILMVANWGEFKRHWDLFGALAKMPANLRIVLIGQREAGRTVETMREMARDFGVPQDLQFVQDAPIGEVARHQSNAKVSVIMSRREGCCVAAVESLFAGCALSMREDAHVGPLAYINATTGARLRPGHLAEDLMALLNRCNQTKPREWAVEHLAGEVSWAKVNAWLANEAKAAGRPWTQDIVLPQWRPHPTFARPEDQEAMRPVYEELVRHTSAAIGPELLTESWR